MISSTETPAFSSVLASASAKIPHLLLILCSVYPEYRILESCSGGISSLRAVFSMKVPVPPEQALCIRTCLLLLGPFPLKKMVFMSSPPISLTKRTNGCSFSTAAATATTS